MRKKVVAGLLMGILTLALTGCWDQLSLADRASALVMSVKPASNHRLQWTFYFPNPGITVSSISNISSTQQFYTASTTAVSLGAAYQKVQVQLARDLYLGQLEDVVFSQDLPAQTVNRVINAYNRDGILPKTVYLLAEPTAVTALPTTLQEPVPTVYFTKYFECRKCQPVDLSQPAWQVWDEIHTPGISPVLPYGTQRPSISELLVYPTDGMPHLLNHSMTLGWAYLTNHIRKESLSFKVREGLVSMSGIKSHAKVKLTVKDGVLVARVKIHAEGALTQWPDNAAMTPRELKLVQSLASRQILHTCLRTIQFANQTRIDPFGWGRDYLFRHPQAGITNEKRRGMIWPIEAHIAVTTRIPATGVSP